MLSVRRLTDKLRSQSLNEDSAVSISSSHFTAKVIIIIFKPFYANFMLIF